MEPQIKDMQYLLSATLKTLQNPTESNDTPKIPQRLRQNFIVHSLTCKNNVYYKDLKKD